MLEAVLKGLRLGRLRAAKAAGTAALAGCALLHISLTWFSPMNTSRTFPFPSPGWAGVAPISACLPGAEARAGGTALAAPWGVARGRARRGPRGAGRRIHRLFDGQIDAVVVINADDLHLDLLSLREVVLDVVHVGIGDLRNVHQPGPAAGQRHKRAEFCDSCHFSFQDRTNTKLHTFC